MPDDARLTADELIALVERVFAPGGDDTTLAILVDLPDDVVVDNADWRERRQLAAGWAAQLAETRERHGRDVGLFWYRNVRANNADLPRWAWHAAPGGVPDHCDALAGSVTSGDLCHAHSTQCPADDENQLALAEHIKETNLYRETTTQ